MAARVVLKNITSPPNLILLLMSSGNLQPYTCKSMFHTLFHLLLKSQHNLHYDIACIMFHIIFSHPHSPLVILIDEYVISSNTLLYHHCIHHSVTLRSLSLSSFPFDPLTSICSVLPIAPTRSHMSSSARWLLSKVSRSVISLPLP